MNRFDSKTILYFVEILEQADIYLYQNFHQKPSDLVQNIFQNITKYIEEYLESINTTQNISLNSVGILSISKNSSIYSFSQIKGTNSSLSYSTTTNHLNLLASITIDPISIENLAETDIYTFYYLPSSLFRYAQKDQSITIVSPIVGIHIPKRFPRFVKMTFLDRLMIHTKQAGKYSCAFWQFNHWNESGCIHSVDYKLNLHFCSCNHTTSFGLIFIPHKIVFSTSIPAISIAVLSIICFFISIILSINRQAQSFRHLSIANIFTLSSSIVLFILLTFILIRSLYISKENITNQDHCSILPQNLVITTYFFLILTFASKTLLGIGYFLTIFFHFIFIEFTTISNRWFCVSFLFVIFIALIPTMAMNIVRYQWTNLFLQYGNICWLNTPFIVRFISIPIGIFLGLNILIICGITMRLIQFAIGRKKLKKINKRMIVSIMIWTTLCVSLGVAWLFGPFLDILIEDKNQTSSKILQWLFGLFSGLEGVFVLTVNIIFYHTQKKNMKSRQECLNKLKN